MDLIAVSLCIQIPYHLLYVKPHAMSYLSCATGCENGATYNSVSDQCDCVSGNSGAFCGECRVGVSHTNGCVLYEWLHCWQNIHLHACV